MFVVSLRACSHVWISLLRACVLKLLQTETSVAPKSHLNVICAFARTSLTKRSLFKSHGGTKYVTIVTGGTQFQMCMLNECGHILSYVDMHVHMPREASTKMSELFAVGSISMESACLCVGLVEYFGFCMSLIISLSIGPRNDP